MAALHISPAQFYDLAPVEFESAMNAFNKIQESNEKFELEKMRLQTIYLVNIHAQHPIRDVRKLMPFPWDIIEIYIPTEEEWDELQALTNNLLYGIKNN